MNRPGSHSRRERIRRYFSPPNFLRRLDRNHIRPAIFGVRVTIPSRTSKSVTLLTQAAAERVRAYAGLFSAEIEVEDAARIRAAVNLGIG